MRFKSYFLTLSFLATSISLLAAPSPSASPTACGNNPNYEGEWTPICIGTCPVKVTKNPNGTVTKTEQECLFGIPAGSKKGTKSTCHCVNKKPQPKPKTSPTK